MKNVKMSLVALTLLCLALPALVADAALPDGLAGFRGVLRGTIVSKTDNSLVLKVEKIGPTWRENKATKAEAAIGQELTITIAPERERLIKALAERKVGELVDVGAMNTEGDALAGVELLKKVEADGAAAPAPAPASEEVTRLRNQVAELQKQVAELAKQVAELKAQLAKTQNP